MNVDGQSFNPESQSYGHNDDIHIQGNLSPNESGNNVENVPHNEANVSSSNDHYLSEMDIEEDLFERDGTEENKLERNSSFEIVDVDETFVVSSVVGEKKFTRGKTLFDKQPCQSLNVVLSKRKKKIGKRDRCCSECLFCHKDGTFMTDLLTRQSHFAFYSMSVLF